MPPYHVGLTGFTFHSGLNMIEQSLDDLKAENQAEEEGLLPDAQVDSEDADTGSADVEAQDESEEVEDWLKDDDQASQSVPLAKHVQVKHKLRARLEDKDSELEVMRQKLAQYEAGAQPQQMQQKAPELKIPTLSQFDYDEDQYNVAMADYQDKLVDYKLSQKMASTQQSEQQKNALDKQQKAVDAHYERAAKLIESAGIPAEKYQAADTVFRRELHSVTGNGDVVADAIISRLGEGGEKVTYHLGVNQAAMAQLKQKLQEDPSGISAAVYMGELRAKFGSAVTNKLSKAPKPDSALDGDTNATLNTSSVKKQYEAAHKAGDTAKAFKLRQQAKASGANTSEW